MNKVCGAQSCSHAESSTAGLTGVESRGNWTVIELFRSGLGGWNAALTEAYAKRKGMTLAEVERWLAPILGYDT